jgi:hypothetical protein
MPEIIYSNPVGAFLAGQDTRKKNAMMDLQLGAARTKATRDAAIPGMTRTALQTGDVSELAGVDPQAANQVADLVGKMDKATWEKEKRAVDTIGALAAGVVNAAPEMRPQAYAAARQHAAQAFGPQILEKLPEQYSPEVEASLGQYLNQAVGAAKALEQYKPDWSGAQQGVVAGQPGFFQTNKAGDVRAVPGVQPMPKSGFRVTTNPDGSMTFEESASGAAPVSKPNMAKLEETVINTQGTLDRLREVQRGWRPEYSTIQGKAKALLAQGKDYLGRPLSPEDAQFLQGYEGWKSEVLNNINTYLKEASGAAVTPQEEGRLRGAVPNENDSPTVFNEKMVRFVKTTTRAQARAFHAMRNGLDIAALPLDAMDKVIEDRGNALEAQFKKQGMSQEAAEATALTQVKREFGM